MFYAYAGPPRPPTSQFYYPSQPTLYHTSHSPLLSSHVAIHVPPIIVADNIIQVCRVYLHNTRQALSDCCLDSPHGLSYGPVRSPPFPDQCSPVRALTFLVLSGVRLVMSLL
jgi:hypothetical protein